MCLVLQRDKAEHGPWQCSSTPWRTKLQYVVRNVYVRKLDHCSAIDTQEGALYISTDRGISVLSSICMYILSIDTNQLGYLLDILVRFIQEAKNTS